MRLELEGSDLAKALKAGVAQRNGNLAILQCALLEAADGMLRVTTTDLEAEAIAELPAKVIEPGAVCVNAALLQAAARDGVLKLSQDGKTPMRAEPRMGGKLRLPSMEAVEFPKVDDKNWRTLPIEAGLLARAIAAVAPAAGITDHRFYLNGVAIMPGYIAASDGHRAGMYPLDYSGSAAIIPIRQLKAFTRLLKEGAEVSASFDGDTKITKLRVHADGESVSVRVVDAAFPDVSMLVVDPQGENWAIFDREKLCDAISKFRPFCDATKIGSNAYLNVVDGAAELQASNGENTENLSWALGKHGAAFKQYVNLEYVADACDAIGADKVRIVMAEQRALRGLYIADADAAGTVAQHVVVGAVQ